MACYESFYTNEGPMRCVEGQVCPYCTIGGLKQEIFEYRALLKEVLNEVPHGWGASFSESDLAGSIREALEEYGEC